MSHRPLECEGAPRDLGLQQGEACRGAVRDAAARTGLRFRSRSPRLLPFASGPILGGGAGREVIRHYAHLAERSDGIALGAGLSLEATLGLLTRVPGVLAAPAVGWADEALGTPRLTRALPLAPESGAGWIVRRSRPEVGFSSVEITLPWLCAAVAGVNEAGLAASFVPRALPGGRNPGLASLLVQECLQRFDELEGALEWCLKRPCSGHGAVLLAHPGGEIAAAEFGPSGGRVRRAEDGLCLLGATDEQAVALRKRRDAGRIDAEGLVTPDTGALAVDPETRGLVLVRPEAEPVVATL